MPGLALLLIVGLAVSAIRSPIIRRIGFRNAVRRPREAMLVMLGCVLGTALIVGSGAVATSFTASIRDQALTKLGPLDAKISYDTRDDWAAANARLAASPIDGIHLTTAAATLEVPITSDSSAKPSPRAKLIEVNYRRARELTKAGGVQAGTGPTPGTAWVSPDLATHLNLKVDSVLTVHTSVPDQQLRVTRIVASPLVTFLDGTLDTGDNLLVTAGTIDILRQQDTKALVPRYLTLVEAKGAHTKEVQPKATVDALRTQLTQLVAPFNGNVSTVRADSLETAKLAGDASGQLLVTIGAFGIIAGIMLLINVLLMLAEERLAELGTMRAVGLARRPLIASFSIEGAAYALVGSALGGVVGVGLGRLMVALAARAAGARTGRRAGLAIHFALDAPTLVRGIASGFVICTIVVLATSYRVSRLDVIRALRNLPEPPRHHRQAATPLLLLGIIFGPILGFIGYSTPAGLPLMVGPPIAFACLGVLAARRWGYVAGVTVGALPCIFWAPFFQVVNPDRNTPPSATVVGGMVIVVSGVMFLNAQQARLAELVRRLGRGRNTVTTRLGLANPIAHRVRMLLTVTPFALVVFTLTYAEGLSQLFTTQIARITPIVAGGYDVYANSSAVHPFDFSKLDDTSVTAIAPVSSIVASFLPEPDADARLWPLTGFDNRITQADPPTLSQRLKPYKTDREVYRAVARDPDLMIVPSNFLFGTAQSLGRDKQDPTEPAKPGDSYTMIDPVTGSSRDITVAGVKYNDVTNTGVFYGVKGGQSFFGNRLITTSAYIATSGDGAALATQLEQAGIDNGMVANEVAESVKASYRFLGDVVNLYRSDLGIGIVVGVAGIGVVLVRSVRDRRRQIGTLRAMGVDANQIGLSFMIEGAFVAVQSLAVGVGLGLVLTMALTQSNNIQDQLGYRPDVPMPPITTVLLTIGLFAAALATCVAPARSASRIPPSVALRLVD